MEGFGEIMVIGCGLLRLFAVDERFQDMSTPKTRGRRMLDRAVGPGWTVGAGRAGSNRNTVV